MPVYTCDTAAWMLTWTVLNAMTYVMESCNQEAIRTCFQNASSLYASKSQNEAIFTHYNDDELDSLCSIMQEAESCQETSIKRHCSKGEAILYDSTALIIKYICNDGKQEYRKHRNCYSDRMVNKAAKGCLNTFNATLAGLQGTGKAHTVKMEEYCRSIDHLLDCEETILKSKCSVEASQWIKFVRTQNFADVKKEACPDDGNSDASPAIIFGIFLSLVGLVATTAFIALVVCHRLRLRQRNLASSTGNAKYKVACAVKTSDCRLVPSGVALLAVDRGSDMQCHSKIVDASNMKDMQ